MRLPGRTCHEMKSHLHPTAVRRHTRQRGARMAVRYGALWESGSMDRMQKPAASRG
jgi:hypothetical protein